MAAYPSPTTHRPAVVGSRFMAATGHPLATMAAIRLLELGGNAIDAGVAAGLCINVLQPDMTNLGGVAPIMLYSAREGAVRAISGRMTRSCEVWSDTDRPFYQNRARHAPSRGPGCAAHHSSRARFKARAARARATPVRSFRSRAGPPRA